MIPALFNQPNPLPLHRNAVARIRLFTDGFDGQEFHRLRAEGFAAAGLTDPTAYRA